MTALTLPSPARRVLVRSFFTSVGALVALAVLILAWWRDAPAAAAVGAVAALGVAIAVARQEEVSFRLYRAWNGRLVRPFGALATRVILRICFLVVSAVALIAGRPRGAGGAWVARDTLPPGAYSTPFAASDAGNGSRAWMAGYVRWAYRTGNLWSVSLLPFLVLLSVLPADEDDAVPANIYTLF